jgi:histidine triad (HIT) family protein
VSGGLCVFCDFAGPVLHEDQGVFVIEPLGPVVPGHVLAIPRKHVPSADALPFVTGNVFAIATMYARKVGLPSYNLISSVGAPATQTVFHLHVHVVPREEGDGLALPWTEMRSWVDHNPWDPACSRHLPGEPTLAGARCPVCRPPG